MSVVAEFDGVRITLFDGQNGRYLWGSRPMASSRSAELLAGFFCRFVNFGNDQVGAN